MNKEDLRRTVSATLTQLDGQRISKAEAEARILSSVDVFLAGILMHSRAPRGVDDLLLK